MFRASLCPSSGEQDRVLLHMVFYTVTGAEKPHKMRAIKSLRGDSMAHILRFFPPSCYSAEHHMQ